MTGRHSMFNAKDKEGRAICAECRLDEILAPFTDKRK